jgi:hypothetical protein
MQSVDKSEGRLFVYIRGDSANRNIDILYNPNYSFKVRILI